MLSVKSVRYLCYERNIDKVKNSIRVPLGDLKLAYWETDLLIHEKSHHLFLPYWWRYISHTMETSLSHCYAKWWKQFEKTDSKLWILKLSNLLELSAFVTYITTRGLWKKEKSEEIMIYRKETRKKHSRWNREKKLWTNLNKNGIKKVSQWMMGTFYLFLFNSNFGKTVQSCFLFLLHLNSRTNSCSLETSDTPYAFNVDQKHSYNSSVKIKCNKKKLSKFQMHFKKKKYGPAAK